MWCTCDIADFLCTMFCTTPTVGDGNVAVGEMLVLRGYKAAASRTVLWVTQGKDIIAGESSVWTKRDMLTSGNIVIAVPAQRLLKFWSCDDE